ncbi:hypothetical protein [Sphingomonas bacterium]|uniref:hypothetical protein n=1 Tax=Sphingomonas bacterium TaxID=1895847 RepID=UPI0015769EB8|nr:hypothetical protein [Sphingomonas bacterium]
MARCRDRRLQERMMVHFDPYGREHTEDSYPVYARLRAEAPVYHNAERQFAITMCSPHSAIR